MDGHLLMITPQTRVGALLEAYPELESLLMEMSPAFSRLTHPVLRKTVARVATLQQAATVGGIPVQGMVLRLRQAVGQADPQEPCVTGDAPAPGSISTQDIPPEWFGEASVVDRFDATPMIQSGDSPMGEILSRTSALGPGEMLELTTPFVPAPIIDVLDRNNFQCYTRKHHDLYLSYFCKKI